MPMLRDDGPPVSPETMAEARQSLPLEYGYKIVNERGRNVLLVRSPRAKPDYLHELAEVALYVSLEEARDVKDVLLIGTEKSCRLEPLKLRDFIKTQHEEDQVLAEDLLRRLDRMYGMSFTQSSTNHEHRAFAIRIPRRSVSEITPDDVKEIRNALGTDALAKVKDCVMAYIVGDSDFERLGRRVFLELVAPEAVASTAPGAPSANPTDALKAAAMAASGAPAPQMAAPPPPSMPAVHQAPAPKAPVAASAPIGPYGETQPMKTHMENLHSDDNTEVYVRKGASTNTGRGMRAAAAAARAPVEPQAPPPVPAIVAQQPADETPTYSDGAQASRVMERSTVTEEFEVFVSKPKGAPTPPQHVAMPVAAPAPASAPVGIVPPTVASPAGPAMDNGAAVEPSVVAQVDEVGSLRAKLTAAGYEVVNDVEVMGEKFEFAAHKADGKRILVKRLERIDAAETSALAKVATELAADVCLAVAREVAPGARVASWGTRVAIVSPEEAARSSL